MSREAKELRAAIAIVVYQNQQLTALLAQMHERLTKLEPPPPVVDPIDPPKEAANDSQF